MITPKQSDSQVVSIAMNTVNFCCVNRESRSDGKNCAATQEM